MKPQNAWNTALGQLQREMPKAAFDTWVRDAELLQYEDGEFTIGVFDAYARDWLESRLSSTLTRLLTGIMNCSVEIDFVVHAEEEDGEVPTAGKPQDSDALQFQIQVAHQSLHDALIAPQKVVVIPGYFRRWVPFLGATLAWIIVAFRQVMYLGTRHKVKPEVTFRTSPQQVARWAGIARNTLWRNMKDHRLRWFLKQQDPDNHVYAFTATMPLTPGDTVQLEQFLVSAGAQSNPVKALETALNTPASQILLYPPLPPEQIHLEMEPMPRSVQDVVLSACGQIRAADFKQVTELATQLTAHLLPPNDVIVVSHYFLRHWVKQLGAAPAWFITLLRDQCYISKDEVRNTVWLHGGDPEIAQMLGLNRPKTISEWLRPLEDSRFERANQNPQGLQAAPPNTVRTARREQKRARVSLFAERIDYLEQPRNTAWKFRVNLTEPLIPDDQENYDQAVHLIEAFMEAECLDLLGDLLNSDGANGTGQGANGTNGGAFGTKQPDAMARLEQVAARLEQGDGANGTGQGANGTDPRRVWNALSSLNHLKAPTIHLVNHLKADKHDLSTTTPEVASKAAEASDRANLVVGAVPEKWDLSLLLASSQLHPGTRKRLLETHLPPWILVSHMLYAHSGEATTVESPMAIVGSALRDDPSRGVGGQYDMLAQMPPRALAALIEQAHSFAVQYPYDYAHNWRSGNQAWDMAMARPDPEKLRWLAIRLGIATVRQGP